MNKVTFNHHKLLVTGDDPLECQALEQLLNQHGYAVEVCRQDTLHRYEAILSALPNPMSYVDRDYIYRAVNDAYLKAFQKRREDIVGRSVAELLGEQVFHEISKPRLDRCLAGERVRYQAWFTYPDQAAPKFMDVTYSPVMGNNGEVIGVAANSHDITDLRESEDKVRFQAQLLDSVQESVVATDLDGRVIYWGKGAEMLYGYAAAEVMGREITFIVAEENRAEEQARIQAVMETGHWQGQYDQRRKDGSEFLADTTIVLAHDDDGQAIGFIGIDRDITARHRMEQERDAAVAALRQHLARLEEMVAARTEELEHANLHLQELARLKDEFLAGMSHELRSPLNAMLVAAQVLQEPYYGTLTEKQLNSLRLIEQSGEHLLQLITDILDMAKLEAGKVDLEWVMVAPVELCQSCHTILKCTLHKKALQFSTDYDSTVIDMLADGRRLKQILINLLDNAIKFTPQGGRVSLSFRGDPETQTVCFEVCDSGIGINEELMERLFQPFVQLDSRLSRQYEGTGLGLSLVKSLTDLHGGSVSLESSPGQGSCFRVILPWKRAEPVAQPPAPPARIVPQSTSGAKVLVVEDNPDNCEVLVTYLQARGYRLTIAEGGVEALQRANIESPDIILMDVQMPGMDGLETSRHLRRDPRYRHIPIIALTALVMPGDRERCLRAGMDAYLAKPVKLKELLQTIENLLRRGGFRS